MIKSFITVVLIASSIAAYSAKQDDDFFGPIIPKNTLRCLHDQITKEQQTFTITKIDSLRSYVDRRDNACLTEAKADTTVKCNDVYQRAVIDAATNANIVSEAAIIHCVNHSDMNKLEVLALIHSNDTNVLTLAKRYTNATVDDLRDVHSNDIVRLNGLIDSKEMILREIISNGVATLNTEIDSTKALLLETINLRVGQLDEKIGTISRELTEKIVASTNETLRAARIYADQYANQAPGYTETQLKASAALPNTYNAMIGSDSFVRAVKDTIGEFPVVVKTLKTVDQRTGSSLPSTIVMNVGKDVVYYTGLTSSSLNLSFSNADAQEDGVYTWELMLSSSNDISGTTYGASINYVGNDKATNPSLAFKRIDNERTTHVFAVRLIKIGTVQKWMIAYNYSFKG